MATGFKQSSTEYATGQLAEAKFSLGDGETRNNFG